ncbi:uncharacterized protein LOC110847760 [Folsomia candida]|uniref:uncharacterized protein LOC110847760 n=1 Tax=Folsomia candida TaxID=158441 RepID=UPI000B8FAF0C|nr:uncharacterized protein LOC110847760 [Folsomia candida]
MEFRKLIVISVAMVICWGVGGAELKVLDLTSSPDLTKLSPSQQRQLSPRSVNLSFFVPAFSLFALASQFMPQMFPSLTTTTSSKKRSAREKRSTLNEFSMENFIKSGIVY